MKMPLKLYQDVATTLHHRLFSVRWILLLITTAMFFLSAASTGCPTGGYTLSVAPNTGPSISNPSSSSNPAPLPSNPSLSQPASQQAASASAPAVPVVIPAAPSAAALAAPPVIAAPSAAALAPPSAVTGVGSPVAVPGPAPSAGGTTVTVLMVTDSKNPSGFAFKPETMTVNKGTKVTWINKTAIPHTVTSDDGKFPSSSAASPVMQGQTYSFVFGATGTFKYHCAIHPPQIGTITVQ